jgi:hypothetical protein
MAWAGAIDVKPDNIMQLVDELTVVGKLELVDPVWPGDYACTRCAGPNSPTACATISNSGSPRTGRLGHKTLSDVRQGEMREGRLSCDRPRSCQLHTLGRAYRHRLRSTRRSRPVSHDAFQDLKVRFVPLQSSRVCGASVYRLCDRRFSANINACGASWRSAAPKTIGSLGREPRTLRLTSGAFDHYALTSRLLVLRTIMKWPPC